VVLIDVVVDNDHVVVRNLHRPFWSAANFVTRVGGCLSDSLFVGS